MREVEVSAFVPRTPEELRRHLDPATVVEYEGSFTVHEVVETDDGWIVTAGARGMEMRLAFESREDGLYYEQTEGPLEALRTTLTWAPENEGARVTLRSAVESGMPVAPVSDRLAAWKRRGELQRALDRLAADRA